MHVAQARGSFEILGLETVFETTGLALMQGRNFMVSRKYKRSKSLIQILLNLFDFSGQPEPSHRSEALPEDGLACDGKNVLFSGCDFTGFDFVCQAKVNPKILCDT